MQGINRSSGKVESVGEENFVLMRDMRIPLNVLKIYGIGCNEERIYVAIKTVKNRKVADPDKLQTNIFKLVEDEITYYTICASNRPKE